MYTMVDDSTSLVYISIVHSLMQLWSPDEHCLLLYICELDHANSVNYSSVNLGELLQQNVTEATDTADFTGTGIFTSIL